MKPRTEKLEPKPVADWTIMVYMSGDNNLSAECVWALTEMSKAIDSDKINVIAQFDPSDDYLPTKRFELNKSGLQVHAYGQASHASNNGHGSLAQNVLDVAAHNPRTGEVHFRHESSGAHALAGLRIRDREAQRLALETFDDRQRFNAAALEDEESRSRTDTNSASPITLYNFLSFGLEYYPARHYLVVISGHSGGIMPRYLLRDEGSGRYMTLRQLQRVFDKLKEDLEKSRALGDGRAGKIDILGFDTCLMGMAEICYELKDRRIDTIIGSQTYTPASGWPYALFLEKFKECLQPMRDDSEKESASPQRVTEAIVKSYIDYYKDYLITGMSATLSAFNVNEIGPLRALIDDLAKVMMQELAKESACGRNHEKSFKDALVLAHWETQSYNGELYVDLVDFCECLARRYPMGDVPDACGKVARFARDFVVIKSSSSGSAYQYSNGCAIYFPWSEVGDYFWDVDFGRESQWGYFLEMYTNLTRRNFRRPTTPTPEQQNQIDHLDEYGRNFFFHSARSQEMFLHRMSSDKMSSDKMSSDKMSSDKMSSDKMSSDKMSSDKMSSDKMSSDKMSSDKMSSDKMSSDKSGNPIHSMRNPPIVSIDLFESA